MPTIECTCSAHRHPDDPIPFIGHQPPPEGCPVHDDNWTEPLEVEDAE